MPFSEIRRSQWSEKHIAEHNVTMDEVAQVLAAPHIESPGRDDTIIVAGTTDAGRHLIVVAADDGDRAFVVTARDMTASERRAHRRRMR
jgi:uncharacterized DUF497 family protein